MPRLISIVLGLLASLSAQASDASDSWSAAGAVEFAAAYQAWDGARFAAAADLFQRAATNAPPNVTNYHRLGVAQFHLFLQSRNAAGNGTNEARARAALDAAIAALSDAVKLDESHAESHALLGTLYGMKIDGNLVRGVRFGPRVARHRELALQYGASNPRVQYLLGMCQYHTADKAAECRAALQTLLQAERLFEAEAKAAGAPPGLRWGHDSCLTFIGRAQERLGQPERAAEYFRKALAMHPADHLAQEGLKRVAQNK